MLFFHIFRKLPGVVETAFVVDVVEVEVDVVLVYDVLVERVFWRFVTSVDGCWVDDVAEDSETRGPFVVDEYLPPSKIQEIKPII